MPRLSVEILAADAAEPITSAGNAQLGIAVLAGIAVIVVLITKFKLHPFLALIIGALQLLVALGVFMKNQLSRWTGVVILCANALAQLLMMPAYPFWSLTLIAIDILALYGLIAYGKRIGED